MDPQSIAAFRQTSEEKPPKQVRVSVITGRQQKNTAKRVLMGSLAMDYRVFASLLQISDVYNHFSLQKKIPPCPERPQSSPPCGETPPPQKKKKKLSQLKQTRDESARVFVAHRSGSADTPVISLRTKTLHFIIYPHPQSRTFVDAADLCIREMRREEEI